MSNLSALIVDDETLARRGLKLRLLALGGIDIVGECANGRQALAAIAERQPDLVFLDIQMPGLNGFDVVRAIQGDKVPAVVFVTAFGHYAVDAFDIHAVDYLLKPIDDARLQRAICRVRERLEERDARRERERLLAVIGGITGKPAADLQHWQPAATAKYPEKIAIKDGSKTTLVPVATINWVDAAGDYMCIHAGDEIHVMRITMKQLERQLDPAAFQRIHRSTLVNLNRVEKVCAHINGDYHLVLGCGTRLKMSRRYKDKVQRFL